MIGVVTVIIRIGSTRRKEWRAVEQVVIAKLGHLRARGVSCVRSIRPDVDQPAVQRERTAVRDPVLVLAVSRYALLTVVGLVSVGQQLLDVRQEAVLTAFSKKAAVGV